MSDSGRQMGDCRHGKDPQWCCECLRVEVKRLESLIPPTPEELKIRGAEAILQALFESSQKGHSFGQVMARFRELAGVHPRGNLDEVYPRLQCAGGLTVNNLLFEAWEGKEDAGVEQ